MPIPNLFVSLIAAQRALLPMVEPAALRDSIDLNLTALEQALAARYGKTAAATAARVATPTEHDTPKDPKATPRAKRKYLVYWHGTGAGEVLDLEAAAARFSLRPNSFAVYVSRGGGQYSTVLENPATGAEDILCAKRHAEAE